MYTLGVTFCTRVIHPHNFTTSILTTSQLPSSQLHNFHPDNHFLSTPLSPHTLSLVIGEISSVQYLHLKLQGAI